VIHADPPETRQRSPAEAETAPRHGITPDRSRTSGWLRRIGLTALTAVVLYLAVPQVIHASSNLTLIANASPFLLALAFVLEACSLASYTALSRAVLPLRDRPGYFEQFRIDLTGLGVSHVVPGGGASAAALRLQLMKQRGVPVEEAASGATIQTALGVVGLVATFTGGVVLVGPGIARHPGYAVAGAVSAAALLTAAFAAHRLRRSPATEGDLPRWHPRRLVPHKIRRSRASRWAARVAQKGSELVRSTAQEAVQLIRDPRRRRLAVFGWAAGNWLFDAACLWVCLRAYNVTLPPGALLTAYGAANLVGLLPISPGGIGIVEGVLIPALTALGGAAPAAVTLGVLTWRIFEFWLPIPVSGLTYLSLKLHPRHSIGTPQGTTRQRTTQL
jgi:uncharacterized membrane protein YbhN (UPF0104 family)